MAWYRSKVAGSVRAVALHLQPQLLQLRCEGQERRLAKPGVVRTGAEPGGHRPEELRVRRRGIPRRVSRVLLACTVLKRKSVSGAWA